MCTDLIRRAIIEEPPLASERRRYHPRRLIMKMLINTVVPRTEGKKWLAELEAREKERTGIKNLKIKYNKCIWLLLWK